MLLEAFDTEVISAGALDLEPEETGTTFIDNAILKAVASTDGSGLPALADDSGLSVDALNGDPGLFSARWAGPEKDFSMAMERVRNELGEAEDRTARFICALALSWPMGRLRVFRGKFRAHTFSAGGSMGLDMTRFLFPTVSTSHLARWILTKNTQ